MDYYYDYKTYEMKAIGPPPLEQAQMFLFTDHKEALNESGRPSSITWEREVKIVHTGTMDQLYKFQVFLSRVRYKYSETDVPYYRSLLERMALIVDELVLWTDGTGTLMNIHNYPFVQYMWEHERESLILQFDDDECMQHITFMDEMICDHDRLLEYLKKLSVYGLYFNGYWGFYKQGHKLEREAAYENGATLKEAFEVVVPKKDSNRLVELVVSPTEKSERTCGYVSRFCYLDGFLESGSTEIKKGTETHRCSVKWMGNKPYIK